MSGLRSRAPCGRPSENHQDPASKPASWWSSGWTSGWQSSGDNWKGASWKGASWDQSPPKDQSDSDTGHKEKTPLFDASSYSGGVDATLDHNLLDHDLMELRLKLSERKVSNVLHKHHRLRREGFSVQMLKRFARFEIGDKVDSRVVDDRIADSFAPDGFLMATKVSKKAKNAVRSTWQNMQEFVKGLKKRTIAVAAEPQTRFMVAGKLVEDCPSDHEGTAQDYEASSADAHNDHDLDDGDNTVVSSHLSLRSSTRMTPSKKKRNNARAALHALKKARGSSNQELEGGDADDESEGEATDLEGEVEPEKKEAEPAKKQEAEAAIGNPFEALCRCPSSSPRSPSRAGRLLLLGCRRLLRSS